MYFIFGPLTDPQALRLSHRAPPDHSTPRRHAKPQTRTGDQEIRVRIPSDNNPYWNRAGRAHPAHSTSTRMTRRTVSLLANGSRFTVTVFIGPPRRIEWPLLGRSLSESTGGALWSGPGRFQSLTGCGGDRCPGDRPRLGRWPRGCRGRWWGLRSLGLRRGVSLVQWLGLDSRRPRTRTARAIRTRKIRSRLVSLSFTVDT